MLRSWVWGEREEEEEEEEEEEGKEEGLEKVEAAA